MLLRHVKIQMYLPKLLKRINASINNGDFPLFLKLANVIPVFKKDSKNSKDNYRTISILKNISKVYERILFKQIGTFMDNFFQNFNAVLEKVVYWH